MNAISWCVVQLLVGLQLAATPTAQVEQVPTVEVGGKRFRLAEGVTMELVAGPPLVERPIVAALDEQGALYVAESSGSNDPVDKQLAERPHKILKLTDGDGDGKYDSRTEFVSNIMFPEGTLWHDGSLYVSAPPQIWKFTDTDGDGKADREEVWLDAITLTGCANDLHGPYLGPDGWIYWCKGAFAAQHHELTDGSQLVSRAAHIFRRRPSGGPLEPVMNGGMDNPVDVTFTRGGERIFTTTFLQHPAGGQRDGLIHAIYGGLYGKDHDVLRGHIRTGPLMPTLEHMGAAAPAGLTRLETDGLGAAWQDQLLACAFNLHQLSAHQLTPSGATFTTQSQPVVASDDLDFHPTDVIEDYDGSVLVVNTGGWYKLCCPTSQLWKPDVLGAIYRLRSTAGPATRSLTDDPHGNQLDWKNATDDQLAGYLQDVRPAVWRRAQRMLVARAPRSIQTLGRRLADWRGDSDGKWPERWVWTLCQIDQPEARPVIHAATTSRAADARLAALHTISVQRDATGLAVVLDALQAADATLDAGQRAAQRRAAAEALGRLGDASALEPLLAALGQVDPADRALQHSLIYALWEIRQPAKLLKLYRNGSLSAAQRNGLLWAAEQQSERQEGRSDDQQVRSPLTWNDVSFGLVDANAELNETAWWVVQRHDEWAPQLREWLDEQWAQGQTSDGLVRPAAQYIAARLNEPAMASWAGRGVSEGRWPIGVRQAVLAEIGRGESRGPAEWSAVWVAALTEPERSGAELKGSESREAWLGAALAALQNSAPKGGEFDSPVREALGRWAVDGGLSPELRLQAMMMSIAGGRVPAEWLTWVWQQLGPDPANSPGRKMRVLDLAERLALDDSQWGALVERLAEAGPYELPRMAEVCWAQAAGRSEREQRVLERLSANAAAESLEPKWLEEKLVVSDESARGARDGLLKRMVAARADRARQLEDRLQRLPAGDIRRGQEVFHSVKAACFTCHAVGYRGGRVGPDLSQVGRIRSRRDLAESVLYPSASWVRSYEPMTVVLRDGRSVSGLLQGETAEQLVLVANASQVHRVARGEVEELRVGGPSVMPEGLGQVLSDQELADLLTFLESRR